MDTNIGEIPVENYPRIVIIGGGFAGITLAKTLKNKKVQILMLDKNNYHTFQPLLYQVATAGLEPDSIAYPIRKIFKGQSDFIFRMAEVLNIRPETNSIETSIGKIDFDYLVIASGSKTNFYGLEDMKANAVPMKSVPEALDLRSLILQNLEKALLTSDIKERERLMNIVVVGGGPTGVEIAGALGELKKHILPSDYPELDTRQMHIYLIEALDRLLISMSIDASKKAVDFLEELGINVWLNTGVKSYDGSNIILTNGKTLTTHNLIWSAGVMGATIQGINENLITHGNRIKVDYFNRLEGSKNIFAIGDVAAMISKEFPNGFPMLAPVAIQQAENLATNIIKLINKEEMKPFVYIDKGSMATVGRNKAVADLPNFKSQGVFAWFIWCFVHLMFLVGFRNKAVVFVNWVWSYFSYDRGIRLIIRPYKKN